VGRFILENYSSQLDKIPTQEFNFSILKSAKKLGDITNFLTETEKSAFQPEEYERYEVNPISQVTQEALLGDSQPEIFVAGTSYAAPNSGFEDGIRLSILKDTVNYAPPGQGPWEPIKKFIKDMAGQKYHPKLLVWEFPERFLYREPTFIELRDIIKSIQELPTQK
jgi:alginate O-acetyltransferase complex protein AlgJ